MIKPTKFKSSQIINSCNSCGCFICQCFCISVHLKFFNHDELGMFLVTLSQLVYCWQSLCIAQSIIFVSTEFTYSSWMTATKHCYKAPETRREKRISGIYILFCCTATKRSDCHTHLVKYGEVAVCCEDAAQDAVTEVAVSHVASRTRT